MEIQIENLSAQARGMNLTLHQKADALIEFNKLIKYMEELEEDLFDARKQLAKQQEEIEILKHENEQLHKTINTMQANRAETLVSQTSEFPVCEQICNNLLEFSKRLGVERDEYTAKENRTDFGDGYFSGKAETAALAWVKAKNIYETEKQGRPIGRVL